MRRIYLLKRKKWEDILENSTVQSFTVLQRNYFI